MSELVDPDFGHIVVRRSAAARHVRVRVAPDGRLRASLPLYAPLFVLKKMLRDSRDDIRALIAQATPKTVYKNGEIIGKSHTLIIREVPRSQTTIARHDRQLVVEIPEGDEPDDPETQRQIRDEVIKILRREAKAYLPRRLEFLAAKYGFSYETVRFSHASSRWGSCSSHGTISLNIALMKLPFELIDYVLLHELAHTREMNHKPKFWKLVKQADPDYKLHRATLKKETPSI